MRGQWVEGITGTTKKGHMDKIKGEGGGFGWGGVEGWRENAHNCN